MLEIYTIISRSTDLVLECQSLAYSTDDIGSVECYVLDSWRAIVVDVFLDLALPLGRCRLVEWHLDGLVPVGHHYRPQGTVLGVHLLEMVGIRWKYLEFNKSG